MEPRHSHPLDIELLSYALGEIDGAALGDIEEHLESCLLCRIHLNRIRSGLASPQRVDVSGVEMPPVSSEVLAVLDSTVERGDARSGQLWLAGDSYRIPVWIEGVDDDVAFVYAATLDVDAADDTALVVDVPGFGWPVAVFTSIKATIDVERLVSFIAELPIDEQIGRLVSAAATGGVAGDLVTGPPIGGVTDERLEFRQALADALAALDPIDDDEDEDDSETSFPGDGHLAAELRNELEERRGPRCKFSGVNETVFELCAPLDVAPVAVLRELGCVVLILSTDTGPDWALEHSRDASELMDAASANAVGFAASAHPYHTVVFERPDLRDSYELPNASVKSPPRPAATAKPIVTALDKYLNSNVLEVQTETPVARPSATPDLGPHIQTSAFESIKELKGVRSQTGKKRALAALSDADAQMIAEALELNGDGNDIIDAIDQALDR